MIHPDAQPITDSQALLDQLVETPLGLPSPRGAAVRLTTTHRAPANTPI